jgi:hypothetical protein
MYGNVMNQVGAVMLRHQPVQIACLHKIIIGMIPFGANCESFYR